MLMSMCPGPSVEGFAHKLVLLPDHKAGLHDWLTDWGQYTPGAVCLHTQLGPMVPDSEFLTQVGCSYPDTYMYFMSFLFEE